jgi:hypothetical protein
MTALLIIGIILCSIMVLLDLATIAVDPKDNAAALAVWHLIPLIFAIIAMSIVL